MLAENDNVSFKDFALRCARNFGALVDMRDEPLDAPIPERFEPKDRYKKRYENAKDDYENFVANPPSEEEIDRKYAEYVTKMMEAAAKYNKEIAVQRKRYEAMLEKAREWEPPTSEHENLKKFMIQQLEDCIEFDCGEYDATILGREEWVESLFSADVFKRRMDYCFKELQREISRVEERNRWLKELRESLEGID